MDAQHDTPERKRNDVIDVLARTEVGMPFFVCRGNPAYCTKYQPKGMACCAHFTKERGMTADDVLKRCGPN